MADPEHPEIFIIKRHRSHEDEHHSGAWKIAFADFMTAMMALFLVLWLISSTSDKTKHTVAQYFDPVKLVDMTTLKKGFRDPKDTEMGTGPNIKESQPDSKTSPRRMPLTPGDDGKVKADPDNRTYAEEAALFRDPYEVLGELAGRGPSQASTSTTADDAQGTFSDPFITTPQEQEKPPGGLLPLAQGSKDGQGEEAEDTIPRTTEHKTNHRIKAPMRAS